MTIYNSY